MYILGDGFLRSGKCCALSSTDYGDPRERGPRLMTDVLTRNQRSYCMSQIRARDTEPEVAVRRALFRCGLRYRVRNRLPGRPDVVFARERVAVFVDGCFWHRCPLHATRPAVNAEFWKRKLSRNVERDIEVTRMLRREGWLVVRCWEHEVDKRPQEAADRIRRAVLRRRTGKSGL
jgi:DNA mismatch endonuclease (patch repair protein)